MPFEHKDAFDFVVHLEKTMTRPGDKITVINLGDEFDQHTLRGSSLPDPDGKSCSDELREAIEHGNAWYRKYPKMFLCDSNHSRRAFKRAYDAGLSQEFMRKIGEVYKAPEGWKWAQKWEIDNIVHEHGENVSGIGAALNAAIQNRKSTVIGHQHSNAGIIWSGSYHDNIFGMNTGCLIDTETYAFKYGITYRKKPTLGASITIDGIPMWFPMILDHKRRWIRRLI